MSQLNFFFKLHFHLKGIKIDLKCYLKHKENNSSIKQEESRPNLT